MTINRITVGSRILHRLLAVSIASVSFVACIPGDDGPSGQTEADDGEEPETSDEGGATDTPVAHGSDGEDSTSTTSTTGDLDQSGSGSGGGSSGLVSAGESDAAPAEVSETEGTGGETEGTDGETEGTDSETGGTEPEEE